MTTPTGEPRTPTHNPETHRLRMDGCVVEAAAATEPRPDPRQGLKGIRHRDDNATDLAPYSPAEGWPDSYPIAKADRRYLLAVIDGLRAEPRPDPALDVPDLVERIDIVWKWVRPDMKAALSDFYGQIITDLVKHDRVRLAGTASASETEKP